MDKLRALQYLLAAAAERSFSGAARMLEVSVPAVAKMITALEKDLGVLLFERTTRGLTLTAGGASYLEACAPALAQLEDADEQARAQTVQLKGTLVIGVQHVIARGCLTAALPRFHARHPDIDLDVRAFQQVTEAEVRGVDVMVVLGWPKVADLVCRRIGAGRYMVVASPAYWAAYGIPERPKDLEKHTCLTIRGVDGTVMSVIPMYQGADLEDRAQLVAGTLAARRLRHVALDCFAARDSHKVAIAPEGTEASELLVALRKEHDFWGPIIKASGFTPEA